jgi:hypothetical protein
MYSFFAVKLEQVNCHDEQWIYCIFQWLKFFILIPVLIIRLNECWKIEPVYYSDILEVAWVRPLLFFLFLGKDLHENTLINWFKKKVNANDQCCKNKLMLQRRIGAGVAQSV